MGKIEEFFKKKSNWILLIILFLAFYIRLEYYDINTGFWWDESEYLNMGKHFSSDLPMNLNPQRPVFFPLFISTLYTLGFGITGVRFIAVLLPSFLTVLFLYLLGKEMFNKKIGLVAAAGMSVYWLLLFNTARVHTDAMALMFNILTILFFWKGWVVKKNMKFLGLAGLFAALGFMTRIAAVLIPLTLLVYVLIADFKKLPKLVKSKKFWVPVIVAVLAVVPYLIWAKKTFGNYLAFTLGYVNAGEGLPLGWHIFKFVGWQYMGPLFFIALIIGALMAVYKILIGIDLISKNKKIKAELMTILIVLVQLFYFVVIQRAAEDRWVMPAFIGLFILSAKPLVWIADMLEKRVKYLGVTVLILLVFIGGWWHVGQAERIIENKKDSEGNVFLAGQWMKERSSKEDIIMSSNVHMELLYSSEREIQSFGSNENETIELIEKRKPKYLVLSRYYNSEQWHYELPSKYPENFKEIKIYTEVINYQGQMVDMPMLVIYEIKSYEF